MTIEIVAIAVAAVLFGGLFLALAVSYQDIEAERDRTPDRVEPRQHPPALYGWEARNAALAEEMMLRQIEHHLRREAVLAEQFVMNPNPRTLRAGEGLRLGAN
jgi:hypothetical protein